MFPFHQDSQTSDSGTAEETIRDEPSKLIDDFDLSLNEEIFQCFGLFDKNQSGLFQIRYLSKALKCLGIKLTSAELEELEESLNVNGMVVYSQFQAFAFEKMKDADPFEALKLAFQAFDPENEGVIPSDRFKKWMTTLGTPLSDKEAKELVKMGDPGNKGIVVYDDLVGLLLSN